MKYLVSGCESPERFQLLLSLTRITSEYLIAALHAHLVHGVSDVRSADINSVQLSNFTRALNKLNEVAGIVEQIKELDWRHLKSVK